MQDGGDFVSQPRISNVSEQLELRVCRAWHRTVRRGGGVTSACERLLARHLLAAEASQAQWAWQDLFST